MIKVSVLYPNGSGTRFDIDYYCNSHMPMVQKTLGAACKGVAVEQGMGGPEPGSAAPFVAIGHLLFDSLETFQAAFGPNVEKFMQDVPNYTNIQPVVQISAVKL